MDFHHADTLAPLRCERSIQIHQQGEKIWLRVAELTDELQGILRTLPGVRFVILDDEQLVEDGKLVPQDRLPRGPWADLSAWMQVELPSPAYAGRLRKQFNIQLHRDSTEKESNVLVAPVDSWRRFAISAPRVRLEKWSFAINDQAHAVIRGAPLPSIYGTHFVERAGVAVQAGWDWVPAVDPDVLAGVMQLEPGDLALLHAKGGWDRIGSEDFVRATRSAVRLSITGRVN